MRTFKNPLIVFFILSLGGILLDQYANAYIQLQAIYIFINIILALSLNLINGITGQFSLGHAGFMAVGAYCSAFLSSHFAPFPQSLVYLNFIFYALCSGAVAGLFGWMVGLPSLRLKGDYLAIVTLGFGEIIRVAILNTESLGGARGFIGIPDLKDTSIAGILLSKFYQSYILAAFWLVVCAFMIWRLICSASGRSFKSVREDEIAAEAMGINTTKAKINSFVISSFFAGIAGSIYAHFAGYINPGSFSFIMSVNIIIMVVLGGLGSLTGSILSAAVITILPEFLRPLQDYTGVDLRMVIFSLILILIMIIRPQGLFGDTEWTDYWRKYVKKSS